MRRATVRSDRPTIGLDRFGDAEERKQLVAAVLRLADELDIDQSRVSDLEAIRSFSLDPRNSVG